jgi:hypothetical protein
MGSLMTGRSGFHGLRLALPVAVDRCRRIEPGGFPSPSRGPEPASKRDQPMSLSSAKNYALRAARSQDEKEGIELLSKAILELAASIEDTDAKVKRINKSKD